MPKRSGRMKFTLCLHPYTYIHAQARQNVFKNNPCLQIQLYAMLVTSFLSFLTALALWCRGWLLSWLALIATWLNGPGLLAGCLVGALAGQAGGQAASWLARWLLANWLIRWLVLTAMFFVRRSVFGGSCWFGLLVYVMWNIVSFRLGLRLAHIKRKMKQRVKNKPWYPEQNKTK